MMKLNTSMLPQYLTGVNIQPYHDTVSYWNLLYISFVSPVDVNNTDFVGFEFITDSEKEQMWLMDLGFGLVEKDWSMEIDCIFLDTMGGKITQDEVICNMTKAPSQDPQTLVMLQMTSS